jgi:hypothetical protein
MSLVLEPGGSVVLFQGVGSVARVSGLPAGVSTVPALPHEFAEGDPGLALNASPTPAFGTFPLTYDVVNADTTNGDGSPDHGSGDPRPPGWHGPWPPSRPKPPRSHHYTIDLVVRPRSSDFTMTVDPPDRSTGVFDLEQGGTGQGVIRIDRTSASYKNPVSLGVTLDRNDVRLTPSPLPQVAPDQDHVNFALSNTNAKPGSGGKIHFTATGKVSAPGQPDQMKTVTQDLPLTIWPQGDFDLTFRQPAPYVLYRQDGLGIAFDVTKKGQWNYPPQPTLEFSNVPDGVTAEYVRPLGNAPALISLKAGPGARLGSYPNFTVKATAFLNGATKSHVYVLPLTVQDGFTLTLTANPARVVRNGPPVTLTVTAQRGSSRGKLDVYLYNLPHGVTVSPGLTAAIAPDQSSVAFTLKAGCDATTGEAWVQAYGGTGFVGPWAACKLTIADDFALTIAPAVVALTNGRGSANVTLTIAPAPCRPVDVTLKPPPGVTAKPPRVSFGSGTTTQTSRLTAAGAAPGRAQLVADGGLITPAPTEPAVALQAQCTLDVSDYPCCAFTINSFDIRNTRAWHNDTDIVCASLKIDDRKLLVVTKKMGDVNNGHHEVNLTVGPPVRIWPDSKLVWSYTILNNSGGNPDNAALQVSLDLLADAASDALGSLAKAPIGNALADSLKLLIGLALANCDGIVAIDGFPMTQQEFLSLTKDGDYQTHDAYPGDIDRNSDFYKRIYPSAAGCGSNSDYLVSWTLSRRPLPTVPELTADFKPRAVFASRTLYRYEFIVYMVDRYGWLWERGFTSSGWQGFVNHGPPEGPAPHTVATGTPCAAAMPSGFMSAFVVATNGHLFELRQDEEDSWTWVDHGNPPGEQAASDPAVVTGAGGFMGVFVVSDKGQLWELPFSGGWQAWKPHSAPEGTILAEFGPSVVSNSSGIHVFVIDKKNSLDQYLPGTNQWQSFGGSPPFLLTGPPSFFATVNGFLGLVWGQSVSPPGLWISRILELNGADGSQHPVWSPLGPLGDLENRVSGPPAFIPADSDGEMSALVKGIDGGIIQLYRDKTGAWKAVRACSAPVVGNAPVTLSDPVWIPPGWGGFVSGSDGHLYQLSLVTGAHTWTLKDVSV